MAQACASDGSFGPTTGSSSCRSGFDLTLTFEESMLGLLPQSALLLLASLRVNTLRKRRRRVKRSSHLGFLKLVSSALYAASSIALLVLWADASTSVYKTSTSVAAAALEFAGAVTVLILSRLEHARAVRPSHLLQFFLLLMLSGDAVRLRTLFLMEYPSGFVAAASVHTFLTGTLLLLESLDKRTLLDSDKDRGLAPEDTLGLFAQRLFLWLNRLFRDGYLLTLQAGYRKVLRPSDLFDMDEELTSQDLTEAFGRAWANCPHQTKKYAIIRVITKALAADLLRPVIPRLLFAGTQIAQPFLISTMISYVQSTQEQSNNVGYGLIAAFGLNYFFLAIFSSWQAQAVARFRIRLRACLITAIYERTLRISPKDVNLGSATILMNVDVEKVIDPCRYLHEFWALGLSCGISLFILYRELGLVFVAPLLTVLAVTGVTMWIGNLLKPRQRDWVAATEKRVTTIAYATGCMKAIRMLGLSETVRRTLEGLREKEVELHRHVRKLAVWIMSLSNVNFQLTTLATYIPFAIISLYGGKLFGFDVMFTSLAALKLVTTPLVSLMQYLLQFMAGVASLGRIQEYLVDDSAALKLVEESLRGGSQPTEPENPIEVTDADFEIEDGKPLLTGISLSVPTGSLTMVLGRVASGKSVLMQSLIGETNLARGTLKSAPCGVSFCSQSPWLRNATLRQNILGESELDSHWYGTVVWACGLQADFAELRDGDATKVGSKGISLSGGQKNRIALARTLYARKPTLVVDDMLSGLDSSTEKIVFARVFGRNGILRKAHATVVLATHSCHYVAEADSVVILEGGRIADQGPYKELAIDSERTRQLSNGHHKDDEGIQQNDSDEYGSSIPEKVNSITSAPLDDVNTSAEEEDEDDRRSGDLRCLLYYLKNIGRKHVSILLLLTAISESATVVQFLWLKWWAGSSDSSRAGMIRYLCIFIGISLINIAAIAVWITHFALWFIPRSCLGLHANQLNAFIGATFSFLVATDTGSITNRFSQDMMLVDGALQYSWINTLAEATALTANLGIIIAATYPIAGIIPFLGTICWIIQRVYLRTSRQIRLMDLEAKAPLCTHFLETLAGIMTVPLYLLFSIQNWLQLVLELTVAGIVVVTVGCAVALRTKIDPGYLGLALVGTMDIGELLNRFVQSWTELETCLSAVARIRKFATQTPQEPSVLPPPESPSDPSFKPPSLVGRGVLPSSEWPTSGMIHFRNLTASYSIAGDLVLRSINLSIRAGEKIGICGRTGSGKSSLVAALFGLLVRRREDTGHDEGEILIDGEATTNVPLGRLRESIVALPQEPFFLPGTVRSNLAPWIKGSNSRPDSSRHAEELPSMPLQSIRPMVTDDRMESALRKVGLWEKMVLTTETQEGHIGGPLNLSLNDVDAMLSQGERQLFCLARAMMMDGKIVVLDEATSSVDHATDSLMQAILRSAFANRTILAIAHRLETILDFDRVVVMDAGRIVEVGPPDELMITPGSQFRALVEAQKHGGRA